MKTLFLSLALVLLGSVGRGEARTLAQARAAGTLNLYTSADFAPFNAVSKTSTPGAPRLVGFEIDLGNLIAARLGLKPVWTVRDFGTLLPSLRTHPEIDVVIASHAITSARAQQVSFSAPHYCTGGVVLTRTGGPLVSKAFSGKRLAAEEGSTYLSYLKTLPGRVHTQGFQTSEGTFGALMSGAVDAVVTDRFAALAEIGKKPGQNLVIGPMLWKEQVGMAFAHDNTELRLAVNGALAQLMADGSYARLSQQYFGQDIRC